MINAAAYHSGKHLNDEELLDSSHCCPWCGFTGSRSNVLSLQKNPDVHLLRCPRCHAASSSKVATDNALASYYGSYYNDHRENRVTCGSPQRHAAHICRHTILPKNAASISVLDYGGGDGSIGNAAAVELCRDNNSKVEVLVVDYNDRLTKSGNSRISLSHAPNLDHISSGRTFDLVLASAILEHLPQPAGITRQLLRMVAQGGYFYARTPYVAPLLRIFSGLHLRYDFTFPAHFHDLGEAFWYQVVSTVGLDSNEWKLERSRPSVVETSLSDNIPRTLFSYCIKAPWWVLRRAYPYTGGWEVFIRRASLP